VAVSLLKPPYPYGGFRSETAVTYSNRSEARRLRYKLFIFITVICNGHSPMDKSVRLRVRSGVAVM
jgi:hypothetical protein